MADPEGAVDPAVWRITGLPPLASSLNRSTGDDGDIGSLFYSNAVSRVAKVEAACSHAFSVSFAFVDDNEFGAWAVPLGNGYVVAASAGTMASLVDFYARMFTHWDCSKQGWRQTGLGSTEIVPGAPLTYWRRSAVIPSEPMTRIRAKIMALQTFGFIIDHEIAHIALGHCEYGSGSSCKIDSRVLDMDAATALTSQAFEMQADRFAALTAADSVLGLPDAKVMLQRINPMVSPGTPSAQYRDHISSAISGLTDNESQRMFSVLLSIYCMFRLFDDHHWNESSLLTSSHPPGPLRFSYCTKIIKDMYRLTGDTKALTVFRRAEARIGKDGERIFAAALGRTPDRAPLTQSRSRIGQAHYNRLLLQLDASRSRLKAKYPRLVAGDLHERP